MLKKEVLIVLSSLDCKVVDEVRAQIPISHQTRDELYETCVKDPNVFNKDL